MKKAELLKTKKFIKPATPKMLGEITQAIVNVNCDNNTPLKRSVSLKEITSPSVLSLTKRRSANMGVTRTTSDPFGKDENFDAPRKQKLTLRHL